MELRGLRAGLLSGCGAGKHQDERRHDGDDQHESDKELMDYGPCWRQARQTDSDDRELDRSGWVLERHVEENRIVDSRKAHPEDDARVEPDTPVEVVFLP